ncbi:hypothetical protein [Sphingomonas aracearum]|uniref:Uncharacterized protein n=1 Tax=Sphingomonas aracearum TaxID=2283317 RepID=A0A369VXI8_9SPHN|nr:hypothetical protein [Sphingomonas aracearum]RDE06317.1 hypothetical protein DVW87_00875 [Sphingomonas aracearum]
MKPPVIALLSCLIGTPAAAQSIAAVPAAEAASKADPFSDAAAVDDGALGRIAGREDTGAQIAIADQRNTVSGNSVSGQSVTGNIVIDGNAFQNLQGLAVISANSGNNVAINSAMNVTVNLAPRP